MSIWQTYRLSEIQVILYHTVFLLLESSSWTTGSLFSQPFRNGARWLYYTGVAWYGKKLTGFLNLQVIGRTLQNFFYYGNSEVKQVLL